MRKLIVILLLCVGVFSINAQSYLNDNPIVGEWLYMNLSNERQLAFVEFREDYTSKHMFVYEKYSNHETVSYTLYPTSDSTGTIYLGGFIDVSNVYECKSEDMMTIGTGLDKVVLLRKGSKWHKKFLSDIEL